MSLSETSEKPVGSQWQLRSIYRHPESNLTTILEIMPTNPMKTNRRPRACKKWESKESKKTCSPLSVSENQYMRHYWTLLKLNWKLWKFLKLIEKQWAPVKITEHQLVCLSIINVSDNKQPWSMSKAQWAVSWSLR